MREKHPFEKRADSALKHLARSAHTAPRLLAAAAGLVLLVLVLGALLCAS